MTRVRPRGGSHDSWLLPGQEVYDRAVTPTWLDFDRLQQFLAVGTVLAAGLTLIALAVVRPAVRSAVAALVFGGLAVAGVWQHVHLDDTRRTDCAEVEFLGSQVRVAGCPDPVRG
jgi:hypothetical protein